MDFSAVTIIPLAAMIAALVTIISACLGRHSYRLRVSFAASMAVSLMLLQPWTAISLQEWPFLLLSVGLVGLWVAVGTTFGAAFGLLAVKATKAIW